MVRTIEPSRSWASRSTSMTRSLVGTACGCTNDPDCLGLDVRHEGDPHRCYEWFTGCNFCGIHPNIGDRA
jgi:hypothetical protein